MSDDLAARVEALDDKHAISVVQGLSSVVYARIDEPTLAQMVQAIERAGASERLRVPQAEDLAEAELEAGDGGSAARAALAAWAANPATAAAVAEGIERFKPVRQDLGILSVPVALGLTYALIALDLDIDFGRVRIKKAGLSGPQQAAVVKKTVEPILTAIAAFKR